MAQVTHRGDAYDVLAATQLAVALDPCDLVLSNTKVEGADGVELVVQLRRMQPEVLREPFTAEKLRSAVNAMLDGRPR